MMVILDSTAIFHLYYQNTKMRTVLKATGAKEWAITRINYLEILAGASENAKLEIKKNLSQFKVLEFDAKAATTANRLAMQYRISTKNQKDFFIAAIAIANKLPLLTANTKDFTFTQLSLLSYKVTGW